VTKKLVTLSVLAATSFAVSAQAETLRVGTEGAYPPWNSTDSSGELVGFDIDAAREICQRMDMECEFVAQDWDGIIPALQNDRYDVIMAAMSITDERRQSVDFSDPYADIPTRFVALKDSPLQEAETMEQVRDMLEDKVVGVQVSTIFQDYLEAEFGDSVEIRLYDTQDTLNLDLLSGRVDATLSDASTLQDFLSTPEGEEADYFGPSLTGADSPLLGEGMGAAFRQDDDELRERFNAALAELKADGTLSDLAVHWFGFDASTQ